MRMTMNKIPAIGNRDSAVFLALPTLHLADLSAKTKKNGVALQAKIDALRASQDELDGQVLTAQSAELDDEQVDFQKIAIIYARLLKEESALRNELALWYEAETLSQWAGNQVCLPEATRGSEKSDRRL